MKIFGLVLSAVTELVVTVVVFMLIGGWLDGYMQWQGYARLILGALGGVLGFWRLFLRLKPIMNDPS
jgi:positive regulator of sigma E activity